MLRHIYASQCLAAAAAAAAAAQYCPASATHLIATFACARYNPLGCVLYKSGPHVTSRLPSPLPSALASSSNAAFPRHTAYTRQKHESRRLRQRLASPSHLPTHTTVFPFCPPHHPTPPFLSAFSNITKSSSSNPLLRNTTSHAHDLLSGKQRKRTTSARSRHTQLRAQTSPPCIPYASPRLPALKKRNNVSGAPRHAAASCG